MASPDSRANTNTTIIQCSWSESSGRNWRRLRQTPFRFRSLAMSSTPPSWPRTYDVTAIGECVNTNSSMLKGMVRCRRARSTSSHSMTSWQCPAWAPTATARTTNAVSNTVCWTWCNGISSESIIHGHHVRFSYPVVLTRATNRPSEELKRQPRSPGGASTRSE